MGFDDMSIWNWVTFIGAILIALSGLMSVRETNQYNEKAQIQRNEIKELTVQNKEKTEKNILLSSEILDSQRKQTELSKDLNNVMILVASNQDDPSKHYENLLKIQEISQKRMADLSDKGLLGNDFIKSVESLKKQRQIHELKEDEQRQKKQKEYMLFVHKILGLLVSEFMHFSENDKNNDLVKSITLAYEGEGKQRFDFEMLRTSKNIGPEPRKNIITLKFHQYDDVDVVMDFQVRPYNMGPHLYATVILPQTNLIEIHYDRLNLTRDWQKIELENNDVLMHQLREEIHKLVLKSIQNQLASSTKN